MPPEAALTDGAGLVSGALARHALGVPAEARAVMVLVDRWDPGVGGRRRARSARRWVDAGGAAGRPQAAEALDAVVAARRRAVTVEGLAAAGHLWGLLADRHDELAEQVVAGRIWLDLLADLPDDVFAGAPSRWFEAVEQRRCWLAERDLPTDLLAGRLPTSTELTPAVPSLLDAVGCVGVVVVDAAGAEDRSVPPLSDLRWRAPDGATVFVHRRGLGLHHPTGRRLRLGAALAGGPSGSRSGGSPLPDVDVAAGAEARLQRWLRRQIDRLSSVSLTSTLLCAAPAGSLPAGLDLTAALGRFNETHLGRTGVWVVNGSLPDLFTLQALEPAEHIPEVTWDPPPRSRGRFVAAGAGGGADPGRHLAVAAGGRCAGVGEVAGVEPDRTIGGGVRRPVGAVVVRRLTGETQLCVGEVVVRIDEVAGYVSVLDVEGTPLLMAPSGELTAYVDSGDVERFGHEVRGGVFRPVDRAARRRLDVEVTDGPGSATVTLSGMLDGRPARRQVIAVAGFAGVVLRSDVDLRARRTVGMSLRTPSEPMAVDMAVPGGWVCDRAVASPDGVAVWPLRTVASVRFPAARPMVIGADIPTALGVFGSHLEVVVGRRAASARAAQARRRVGSCDEAARTGASATQVVTTVIGWCSADDTPADAEQMVARGVAAAKA